MENINFYKARFGKEPPLKKLRPTPAVTEQYYGIGDEDKQEEQKMNLKKNIYEANQGNLLPPIYYILGCNIFSVPAIHNPLDIAPADDLHLVYCYELEAEFETENTGNKENISPIKKYLASLGDNNLRESRVNNLINQRT